VLELITLPLLPIDPTCRAYPHRGAARGRLPA
jgi:hypothetical protein